MKQEHSYEVVVVDTEARRVSIPDRLVSPEKCIMVQTDARFAKKVLRRAQRLGVVVIAAEAREDPSTDALVYLRHGLRDKRVRTITITSNTSLGQQLVAEGLANTCLSPNDLDTNRLATQIEAELQTFTSMVVSEDKRAAQLDLLTTLARFSKNEVDLQGCLSEITGSIHTVLGAQTCHVLCVNPDAGLTGSEHVLGKPAIPQEALQTWAQDPASAGSISEKAIAEGVTQICIERDDDLHRRAKDHMGINVFGSLAFPVLCDDRCIAVIQCLLDEREMQEVSVELTRTIEKAIEQFGVLLERRHAEEQLADQYERLRSTLEELKQTQSQLVQSEKMASIGQLAAGIAHEINNPIAYIKSNFTIFDDYLASMLKLVAMHRAFLESIDRADLDRVKSLRTEIGHYSQNVDIDFMLDDLRALVVDSQEGVQRVAEIVTDLKDFSRSDVAPAASMDLHQGLDSTLKIASLKLMDGIEVTKAYGQVPNVYCHAGQINQVFMNLIMNAAEAMEGKGILHLSTCQEGGNAVIRIRDTGPGIPESVINHIFDPFYTTKPVGKGTGLGLSISYGIIQRHNGTLSVDSSPDQGAEFCIVLPIKPAQSDAA